MSIKKNCECRINQGIHIDAGESPPHAKGISVVCSGQNIPPYVMGQLS